MNNLDALHARAKALCLHGLLAHWHDATAAGWLHTLIEWEEQECRHSVLTLLRPTRKRAPFGPR